MSSTTTRADAAPKAARDLVPAALRLAGRQARQIWRMLLVMLVGLTIAIATVGALPLFTQITQTAGLRAFITQDPANLNITVVGQSVQLNETSFTEMSNLLGADAEKAHIAPYLVPTTYSATQLSDQTLDQRLPNGTFSQTDNEMTLNGVDIAQMTPFLHVLQGRLPAATSDQLEAAINQDTAARMNAPIGATLWMEVLDTTGSGAVVHVPVHLVGIIANPTTPRQFWMDNSLDATATVGKHAIFASLVSTQTMLTVLASLAQQETAQHLSLVVPQRAYWLRTVDPSMMNASQVDTLTTRFDTFQSQLSADLSTHNLGSIHVQGHVFDPGGLFGNYSARITNVQVSTMTLLVGMIGSALLFVSMLAELVIEQQSSAIAVLRSRGFGRGQIFAALAVQGLIVCGVALVVGALLAVPVAHLIAAWRLPADQQGAIEVLNEPMMQALAPAWLPMLAAVGCTAVAMLVALALTLRLNVLSLRREAARTTQAPLWQRLHLDVVAAVVAVLGLVGTLYLQYAVLGTDPQVDRLLEPLTLLAPIFALLAVSLLLLRGSSVLVQLGARLAQRGKGAMAMLALTQVERAPRQFQRLTLFLTLALAYAVFALSFAASQAQRASDVAAHAAGADFSGTLVKPRLLADPNAIRLSVREEEQAFNAIPGVTSATAGHIINLTPTDSTLHAVVTVIAVDAQTYGQTAQWPPQDATSVPALMQQLEQAEAQRPEFIPAIVDTQTWNALHLTQGVSFALNITSSTGYVPVQFQPIAEVANLPLTPDTNGGMLVDFRSYATDIIGPTSTPVPLDTMWLRTKDDATSLKSVRAALDANGPTGLVTMQDRRALQSSLQQEPLTLTLVGLLVVSVGLPLGLALIGTFIAAWQYVRQRLTGVTVLRALGAQPRQIVGVLAWEQSLAYVLSVVFGVGIGMLFAYLTLPNLIFTNTPPNIQATSNDQIYRVQHVPSVRVVLPVSVWFAGGVVLLLGAAAIALMQLRARNAALGQSLRLNED